MKSRSHEIGCYYYRNALKLDTQLSGIAVEVPFKFQSDLERVNPNFTASMFRESCSKTFYRLVKRRTGPVPKRNTNIIVPANIATTHGI